ncbi:hypothetical protein Ga0074812_10514 [Parafrankia irregularis]|uniref:Uncharacterized protein n=1 Tax=Parafrankia irregularis TaxID=795642 RepID=A0A0S4QLF2_9ACTN|nr:MULTISPECIES: hypothetical protein [Parafrankia]MBE3205733.1 hypothetical protein [Parafrankia sp. CH37]CUU55366.1 hypothetical protein Ga0074812_10514 [Parafrankia irregularis]
MTKASQETFVCTPAHKEGSVATTKVGIREFRAGLADYLAADHPIT